MNEMMPLLFAALLVWAGLFSFLMALEARVRALEARLDARLTETDEDSNDSKDGNGGSGSGSSSSGGNGNGNNEDNGDSSSSSEVV